MDGSVLSLAWDFGDPASGSANYSTAHFTDHCYSTIGMFTVNFTVIDNDNNVDTLRAINSIVIDSSGCYCNYITSVSQKIINLDSFRIIPNPTNGKFLINRILSNALGEISIIDIQGRIVFSTEYLLQKEYVVDEQLIKGIYFVRLSDGERSIIKKLVVS